MISRSPITRAAAVATLAAIVFSPAAFAQTAQKAAPSYTAKDVVQKLTPPKNLGASRAICIGTASECGATAAPQPAPSFDMLISFDYNSDELTTAAKRNLDEFAQALRAPELSSRRFLIEGHTDGQGSEEYNQELSDRRAASVVRYLSGKGIDGSKLVAQGFGKSRPRTSNLLDPANRRVEARVAE